jgi:diacylglycerol kinase (ATP)
LLNTAIERLCDRLHPERDPAIGYVKDLGSAAVLAAIMIVAILWLAALWRFADRYI